MTNIQTVLNQLEIHVGSIYIKYNKNDELYFRYDIKHKLMHANKDKNIIQHNISSRTLEKYFNIKIEKMRYVFNI